MIMDKRWILLLIILLAGLSAMFYIATISNTIGNAVTVIDDVTVTVPPGFKIIGTHTEDAKLQKEGFNDTIFIKCLGDGDASSKAFKTDVKKIKNNGEFEIIKESNKTVKFSNITSGKNTTHTFFEKADRTFRMELYNFDNDNELERNMQFVIDNIQPDFKQDRS